MRFKNLKSYFIALVVCIFAVSGVVLADTIINHYYGSITPEVEENMGGVDKVGGICDGSEETTQLCNVNAYEAQIQTDLTVDDDLTVSGDFALSGNISGYLSSGLADQTASTTALDTSVLRESQLMLGSFTIGHTDDGGANGTYVLTLPATSTMTTMIPNNGDCLYGFKIYSTDTLAASTTVVTAGTGMTIYENENGDEAIAGSGVGVLDFCRRSTTDVHVFISGYTTD